MEITTLENLEIVGKHDTYFTPTVNFNATTGKCLIEGESYLEDSFKFYDELISWINKYFEVTGNPIVLDFKLTYFNTSSSRAILDLMKALQEHRDNGRQLEVNWYYPDPDDDEMKLEAEDYIDESGLEMNLIEYTL